MELQEIYIENVLQPQAEIIEENEPDIEAFEKECERVERDVRESRSNFTL